MLKWKKQSRPGMPTYVSGEYTVEKFEGRWHAYGAGIGAIASVSTLREAKAACQHHSDPCFGSMLALVVAAH